jgi:hypothetical protein
MRKQTRKIPGNQKVIIKTPLMKSDKDGNMDTRLFMGPIAALFRKGIMARIDVKFPVSKSVDRASLSKGVIVQTGIGFVF